MQLAARVRLGDHDAFRALYDRHSGSVLGLAQSVVRDRSAAEDITHDVFLGFWRNPHAYEPSRGQFIAWLLRVTRNRSIDILRRRREQTFTGAQSSSGSDPVDPSHWIPDPDPGPEPQAIGLATAGQIREALLTLPSEHRRLLELAYFGGLTQREIAERVGKPLGTVKTQMRSSLMKLAQLSAIRLLATSEPREQTVKQMGGSPGDWELAEARPRDVLGTEPS